VGVEVGVGVEVAVGVTVGVRVGVPVVVLVGVAVGVGLGVTVGVRELVGVGVLVDVRVGVGVGVAVRVGVEVGVGVEVAVGVRVGSAPTTTEPSSSLAGWDTPWVSSTWTRTRLRGLSPWPWAVRLMIASSPVPLGPSAVPRVAAPKTTFPWSL
jgi:hypothetical protein